LKPGCLSGAMGELAEFRVEQPPPTREYVTMEPPAKAVIMAAMRLPGV
jgi:hypothetical protein